MFGFSYLKIAAFAAVALVILGLTWTANHYHSAWVKIQGELQVVTLERDNAMSIAKECSKRTEAMKEAADLKQETVKKAQEQAAIIAKGNQALANKLLSMEPKDSNRCIATEKLFKDYKELTGKGK